MPTPYSRARMQVPLRTSNYSAWRTPYFNGAQWHVMKLYPPQYLPQSLRNAVIQAAQQQYYTGPGGGFGGGGGSGGRVIEPLDYGDIQDFAFVASGTVDRVVLSGVTPPLRRVYLAIQNNQVSEKLYIRYG